MIDPSGTCRGVCNTPLPIRDKYLTNTYLLNLISGKDWMVRVGAYCIRPTNAHNHGQMIDPPDTCLGVCNTSLPIRYKYLINTYLLNLIPGKDWIVRVGAYYIRSTNVNNHGQMIDPPDTCWGVCNTPLPIWGKNLIPLQTMNLKLGTCWGVCNTTPPIRDKYLINTYLLNLIPEKGWIVCVGAYCIRSTNAHDHRQMIDPPDTCLGVCNTPLPIRIKNLIPLCTMNLKPCTCCGVCNMHLPIRIKNLIPIYWMNLKLGRFLGVCLCDQLHLGGKPLKFVWEHVKPAED